MNTTKEQFLRYTHLPKSYRVYLESDNPKASLGDVPGSVYSAADNLADGKVLVACFDAANRKAADDFAALCREKAGFRVVEGPELVR